MLRILHLLVASVLLLTESAAVAHTLDARSAQNAPQQPQQPQQPGQRQQLQQPQQPQQPVQRQQLQQPQQPQQTELPPPARPAVRQQSKHRGWLGWMYDFRPGTLTGCSVVRGEGRRMISLPERVYGARRRELCGRSVEIRLPPSPNAGTPPPVARGIVWDFCKNCDANTIIATRDVWRRLGLNQADLRHGKIAVDWAMPDPYTVDREGRRFNLLGQRVNGKGQPIDDQGRVIDPQALVANPPGQGATSPSQPASAPQQPVNAPQSGNAPQQPANAPQPGNAPQQPTLNEQGQLVDPQGRLINAQGQLIDQDGYVIGLPEPAPNPGQQQPGTPPIRAQGLNPNSGQQQQQPAGTPPIRAQGQNSNSGQQQQQQQPEQPGTPPIRVQGQNPNPRPQPQNVRDQNVNNPRQVIDVQGNPPVVDPNGRPVVSTPNQPPSNNPNPVTTYQELNKILFPNGSPYPPNKGSGTPAN